MSAPHRIGVLPKPALVLVTNRHLCQRSSLVEATTKALQGGVNVIQLREKDLSAGPLYALAKELRRVSSGRARLLINDRIDVALACGADGVHLGEESLPLEVARSVCGERLIIGRSVHSLEGAVKAIESGADYLILGTIFPSHSHPEGPIAGVELLRRVRPLTDLPLIAIGGITPERVKECIEAGADGVAVISAILSSEDPLRSASALRLALMEAYQ